MKSNKGLKEQKIRKKEKHINGQWSKYDIVRCLNTFEIRVNDLCRSDGLNFTAEIWRHGDNKTNIVAKLTEKVNITKKRKYFPFPQCLTILEFSQQIMFYNLHKTESKA